MSIVTTEETAPGGPATPGAPSQERPPFWRDVRVLRWVGQIGVLAFVVALGYWLFNNLVDNLNEQGIPTGFGFIDDPTQFTPSEDRGFDPRSPIYEMMWVGVKNTFLSASAGILLASVLGLIIGVSRLSHNWLAAKLASLYVETFRNIPPLVIIIFFGFAIFTFGPFPVLRDAWEWQFPGTDTNFMILSNTNWGVPSLAENENVGLFWLLVLVAVIAAVAVGVWRTRLNERTGTPHHRVLYSLGTFVGLTVIFFVALGGVYDWSWPALSENRRRIVGGFPTSAGYLALTIALGMYTASHIAEIIRGSILAVPKGQTEASNALALTSFQRLRFVVLPQALRIAIPPTINQYLNLVKNTSLGIAVAYAEITLLTKSSIGNGRPAPQSILLLMGVYLSFSILISIILNIVNRRFQLVSR